MNTGRWNMIKSAVPDDPAARTVAEVARRADVSKGTARRYIMAMVERGEVRANGTFPDHPGRPVGYSRVSA